jgi:kynureninase
MSDFNQTAPGSISTDAFQPDRAYAETLDAADPLRQYRERFAFPRAPDGHPVIYLCGNSLGLMPEGAVELVNQELADWQRFAVEAHFRAATPWFSYHEALREPGARVVGATPREVVMMNSLTVNLHLLMASFYRPEGTRDKILVEDDVFPSDRYAVASHLVWHGRDPEAAMLLAKPPPGQAAVDEDDLLETLDARGHEIALVLLGGVNYFTGQRFDLARITEAAKAKGCVVGFDLAHAAGNVPVQLHDWNVDFAAWCSYKYLNGGPGAVGGCFVHERHGRNPDLPRLAGWWGNDPATRFRMHENLEFVPQEGADGWQVSNPSVLSMAPLRVSLAMFDEVGMDALRAKSIRLTGYLERLLATLSTDRLRVITPADPESRGCQLSLQIRHDAEGLFRALSDRHVVVDFREPDVIRLAPAPFYNSFQDVWDCVAVLRECLAGPHDVDR